MKKMIEDFAMSSRIKLSYAKNEPKAPNVFPDFEWSGQNRLALNEKYGDSVIVVYEKQVIGVGKTREEALADAEAHLPENPEIVTPIIRYIGSPFRIRKVIRNQKQD
jgi:hypothetical protein